MDATVTQLSPSYNVTTESPHHSVCLRLVQLTLFCHKPLELVEKNYKEDEHNRDCSNFENHKPKAKATTWKKFLR